MRLAAGPTRGRSNTAKRNGLTAQHDENMEIRFKVILLVIGLALIE